MSVETNQELRDRLIARAREAGWSVTDVGSLATGRVALWIAPGEAAALGQGVEVRYSGPIDHPILEGIINSLTQQPCDA